MNTRRLIRFCSVATILAGALAAAPPARGGSQGSAVCNALEMQIAHQSAAEICGEGTCYAFENCVGNGVNHLDYDLTCSEIPEGGCPEY